MFAGMDPQEQENFERLRCIRQTYIKTCFSSAAGLQGFTKKKKNLNQEAQNFCVTP